VVAMLASVLIHCRGAMEKSWDSAAIAVARKGRPSQTR
jgi:hypothetical protein